MTTDLETITVDLDNEPNLRFTGQLIAMASSSPDTAHSDYSGTTGRWTELKLYQTKSGKFVCQSVGRTQWQGENDRFKGKVCDTKAEVIDFFGHGWLAKELYFEAKIEDVTDID